MNRDNLGLAALVVILSGLATQSTSAATRGLVIGIDDYEFVTPLHGAVSDARDIAQALERAGVRDLTLILDREATRANVEAAWQGLLDRSQSGDEIVFTYAGHGAQIPEAVPGSEADGMDEFLVLSQFGLEGPATGERLIDNQINGWFKEAERKGVHVLAEVDACHSGTAFRKLDPRVEPLTTRYVEVPIDTKLLDIPLPDEGQGGLDETALPDLTWLAAAQDDQTVPELSIPDANGKPQKRGAMSWAFARGLEGAADADHDGVLTRDELYRFTEAKVREIAAARQTPNYWPLDHRDLSLVAVPASTTGDGQAAQSIRLALKGDPAVTSSLAASLRRVELVAAQGQAELVYDADRQEVVTSLGDVTAQEIAPEAMQALIDKELTLRRLQLSVAAGQLRTRVLPDDRTHAEGAEIKVAIDGIKQPYLTLFNLASNGTIQYLYPTEEDQATVAIDRTFELGPIYVVPPFGADHIVALVTARPPDVLRHELQSLDSRPGALAAGEAVLAALAENGSQIGVQGIFTGR